MFYVLTFNWRNIRTHAFFANCSCNFLKYCFECRGKKHFKCVFLTCVKVGEMLLFVGMALAVPEESLKTKSQSRILIAYCLSPHWQMTFAVVISTGKGTTPLPIEEIEVLNIQKLVIEGTAAPGSKCSMQYQQKMWHRKISSLHGGSLACQKIISYNYNKPLAMKNSV